MSEVTANIKYVNYGMMEGNTTGSFVVNFDLPTGENIGAVFSSKEDIDAFMDFGDVSWLSDLNNRLVLVIIENGEVVSIKLKR